MTTLLIDGDPLVYQAAFSNQEEVIDWDGNGATEFVYDPAAALADIDDMIAKIKGDLGVTKAVLTVSVSTAQGWRREILPTYKAHRTVATRPLAYEACRTHLLDKWQAYIRPTLEADDVLGILATHPTIIRGEKIIVSIDKDLATIPGQLYNPRRETLVTVTKDEADYLHLLQTLTGDPVDGYAGCPGVGPVKAKRILEPFTSQEKYGWIFVGEHAWFAAVEAYESKGLTESDALIQARVARICRASDYDFKQKRVKLWNPPSSSPRTP